MTAPAVVSGTWLAANLDRPDLRVVENAWVPEGYARAHLPGAAAAPCHPHLKRFDIRGRKTRHVIGPAEFADLCRELGLRRDHHVVVYDDHHGLFAARFRSVCRHYGFDNVSILDGGWQGWLAAGRPVTAVVPAVEPGTDIAPEVRPGLLVDLDELAGLLADPALQIWDTRRAGEFDGSEETDNERRGHLPGARHLVWTDLLDGDDVEGQPRFLKPRADLAALVDGLGLQPDRPVVTYCQSGIRAAFCQLVLEVLGFGEVRLYDGSMGEWANRPHTPLA